MRSASASAATGRCATARWRSPSARSSVSPGPNGAGKSTLLDLAVALLDPSEGSIEVLGGDPRRDRSVLAEVGYVAQGAPLYRSLTRRGEPRVRAQDEPALGHKPWRVSSSGRLSSRSKVSALAEGDRARLALALALGKRPSLLLLDEPFARLDPLAGREFLQLLMDGVAETSATVVIASHVIADIERVCDYIVLLSDGRVRLEGNVEGLIESHRLLTGAKRPLGNIRNVTQIVRARHSGRQSTLLVRSEGPIVDPTWAVDHVGLEELLLAYMAPGPLPAPTEPTPPERLPLRWHG